MATVQDIVTASLRLISVIATGETPEDVDLQDGREALNLMLGNWSAKRLLVPVLTEESFTLVVGTGTYTIGTGATFSTARPLRIESAFLRDSENIDTDIEIISRDKHNDRVLKTTEGRPEDLFYEDTYPNGTIKLLYVPDEAYTLFINSWKAFTQYSALTTTISLPDEYLEALKYNLAVRIAPEYEISVRPEVVGLALDTYNTLKNLNAPDMTAEMDDALLYRNTYSDTYDINTD
jgi:hypothetical protein